MDTVQLLTNLVEHHEVLAYVVIFFGLIFEGEIVVITSGVLAYLGALDFGTALLFILAGGFAKTASLYYLGTLLRRKFRDSKVMRYVEKRALYLAPNFEKKPFWAIFISKFINGVNYIVVTFSGYKKVNLKTYLQAEILSTLIWAPLLMSLGYFFSQTALRVSRDLEKFFFIIVLLLAAYFLFDKIVAGSYSFFSSLKNGMKNNGDKNDGQSY